VAGRLNRYNSLGGVRGSESAKRKREELEWEELSKQAQGALDLNESSTYLPNVVLPVMPHKMRANP
jgi:hypothetical protein